MRRAWRWGLLLLGLACSEQAPPEGAVRVSVAYGSYAPACVRVIASDSRAERARKDLLQSAFKDPTSRSIRIAVLRQADWGRDLSLAVSSYRSAEGEACAGAPLETFTEKVTVPPGNFAAVEVTLRATDADGDGSPALELGGAGLDCDDQRPDVYPGAPERCAVGVDSDCDGARGCQDSQCQQKACDDGNACTTGEVCVGTGTAAQCQGQAVVCPQPTGLCLTGATCARDTGECVLVRKSCPAPASVCLGAGVCNDTTGNCEYPAKPATTGCDDGQVCTSGDKCDGAGSCKGTPSTCTASSVCVRVKGGTCSASGDCTEEPDPTKVDTVCSAVGENPGRKCRTTGQCSRFPYTPSYFDPDDIPAARIVNLTTTAACEVTFDSTSLAWSPAGCVTNSPLPIELAQETGAVLLPILNLSLGGNLKLVGNRPVILAVFNNATLDHDVLSRGLGTTAPGAGGSVALACERRRGRGATEDAAVSGGGGGAGGGTSGANGGKGANPGALSGEGGVAETLLAGGCSGGSGGGVFGGKGGLGGGMIQLSVAGTLTVKGTLSVSGGGGGGGTTSADGAAGGGGGGGSGGRLLLEAQQVTVDSAAHLTANGGGGGEGGAYSTVSDRKTGANGADGSEIYMNSAMGGTGTSPQGGDGGNGGGRDMLAGMGKDGTTGEGYKGGGGGGGGAVGVIRVRSLKPCALNTPYISPNPTDRQCSL